MSKTKSKIVPEFCPECFKTIKKKKNPSKIEKKKSEKTDTLIEIPGNSEENFPSQKPFNPSPGEAEPINIITCENSHNDTTLIKEEIDENESSKKSKQTPSPLYVNK